jgi:hypothetical protein
MRIYIVSNATLKKNILSKLEPYLHNTRYISYIWSVNGLLQVEDNKVYRIKIKDVISKKTLLGAFPVTIDESEFIREEECFQIAPRSHKEYTTLKIYKASESTTSAAGTSAAGTSAAGTSAAGTSAAGTSAAGASSLEWVLEYKDDELHDNYFTLPNGEDIHSVKNKAALLHFLNL